MKKEIEVDQRTSIRYAGSHLGIWYEIVNHSFSNFSDRSQPNIWNTYLFLSVKEHLEFKDFLSDAPWNVEITFYKRKALAELWGLYSEEERERMVEVTYIVGDDFAHCDDAEKTKNGTYNLEYMRNHIKNIIDYLERRFNEGE